MKRSRPPRRTKGIERTPLTGPVGPTRKPKPRKPVKKVNAKRKASEFARCYHSRERVRFVKSLGCIYCTALSPFFGLTTCGKCDNAHTVTDGMGRKSDYTSIVPLCRVHHRMFDEHRGPLADMAVRDAIKSTAAEVERRWRERQESAA